MNKLLSPAKVAEIKNKADRVLITCKNDDATHERLFKIAENNNIKIVEADLYDVSGALRRTSRGWKIYVNRQDSPQRKKFTIAHELGHFFMHTDQADEFVDGQIFTRSEVEKYGQRELEANEFAANVVMPEQKLRQMVPDIVTQEVIDSLANAFEVSRFAMENRLLNLGLLKNAANQESEEVAA